MKTITRLGIYVLLSFACAPLKASSAETPGKIEWNAQNKHQARQIHELASQIYSGDLTPDEMISDLTELAQLLTESPFLKITGMDEFQVVARAVYSWRTTHVEIYKDKRSVNSKSTLNEVGGATTELGPLVVIEAKYLNLINELRSRSASKSTKTQSDGHKIEDLREAWSQSYRLLLNSLAEHGFSPPVDESEIVGDWTWRSSNAYFTFTFNDDHTMKAKIKPDNPKDWPGGGWVDEGKGTWGVDYNRLHVKMNEVWVGAFWKDHCVTWIDDTVKSNSKDTIILDRKSHNQLNRSSVRK